MNHNIPKSRLLFITASMANIAGDHAAGRTRAHESHSHALNLDLELVIRQIGEVQNERKIVCVPEGPQYLRVREREVRMSPSCRPLK